MWFERGVGGVGEGLGVAWVVASGVVELELEGLEGSYGF